MRKIQAQGIHHITIIGADRQTSIDFWEGVLGMPFVFDQPNLDNPDEGHVYFVSRAGILSCLDLKTGEQKWDRRLGASCWASPLAAAGKIYFFDKAGKTLVIKSGGSQTVVAQNDLSVEGTVYGVAALEEVFVLRTGTQLICINTVGKKTSYE